MEDELYTLNDTGRAIWNQLGGMLSELLKRKIIIATLMDKEQAD